MKKSQFAERQYEMASAIELTLGCASPFVPSQQIERYIGIDVAVDPHEAHAIWRILDVRVPRRVQLSPSLWPYLPKQFYVNVPARLCSLFLQFKIPSYQDGERAKYRKSFEAPYYEVRLTRHQQASLAGLENRVGGKAVVRYASPAFWLRADFDQFAEQRRVLEQSAYIAPAKIKNHSKWMYAGISGLTMLNPEPEEIGSETWGDVIRVLEERATEQTLSDHVLSLAEALREGPQSQTPAERDAWLSRIDDYRRAKLSDTDRSLLRGLSVISEAAANAGAAWILLVSRNGVSEELRRIPRHPFGFYAF